MVQNFNKNDKLFIFFAKTRSYNLATFEAKNFRACPKYFFLLFTAAAVAVAAAVAYFLSAPIFLPPKMIVVCDEKSHNSITIISAWISTKSATAKERKNIFNKKWSGKHLVK